MVALPISLLWVSSALLIRQRAQREAETFVLQVARGAAREHEALVEGARQLLPALAANDEVLTLDGQGCSREFARLLSEYAFYANFGAMTPDGLIFCSALPFTPPIDSSDRLYFKEAIARRGFGTGEFQVGRITGIPSVNFGYPAIDEAGDIVAVVFAALDLGWVSDLASEAELPPGATLTIFDHSGTVMARYPDPEAWVGKAEPQAEVIEAALGTEGETLVQAHGLDGVEKIYGIVPLTGGASSPAVYLTVGVPVEQVFAPVMAVARAQLAGLLLAIGVAIAAVWFVGERLIVRRVDTLVATARDIAGGRLDARTGMAEGGDELARLAREFDEMAATLQAREAALLEATSELRRTNRALVMLSACNQVLIRAVEARTLGQEICETVVGHGGFLLAWVGIVENPAGPTLDVLGRSGVAVPYLEETPLDLSEGPGHQGPGITAIRTGEVIVLKDIWKADVPPAWRRLASKYGFASAVGLPLRRGREVTGALTIYSGQPDAFDSEEVRLLSELADDLSFGLEALRKDVERRRAQADIVRLEAFHRGIVENVAEGTVILDPDGHFTYLNSAAETMLGYPAGSLLGRHWKAVVAPADHDFIAARRETRRPGEVDRYDVTLVHRDGEMLEVRVSATQLYEDGVMSGTLSVFSDVTTERKLQRRVELQERLAAVGQLAAGIAHDFNNIVGAMILFGEMLLAEEGLTESARDRIRLIVEQAHRAAELTQQILDFGRKSIVERRPIDLVRFLRDFERLVGRTLPQPIGVQIESDGSAFTISGDPGRLQQALLNLTLNARDAMPEGGRLSFQLEHLVVSEGAPPYRDMHPGPWVLLSVSDTGSGIPIEIQPHIFEPFFTTKPVGEGTGLGLSQVYGIVRQHDGYLDVHSGPGRGTSFLIYLPEMPAVPEMTEAVRADEALGSGETILVVEDDDAARSAIGETLRRMNYHVILAEDGARALESFDAAGDRIALVISDVVMPYMGGMELFRELRKRKPDVRALLVTGYPLGNDTRELLEAGNAGWIQKPFDSRTLGARIRRMLRPRPARQGPDFPE